MKTKVENEKNFDAVELVRSRRAQIGKDIRNMTFKEEKEYFREASEKLKKFKSVDDVR